MEVLIDSDVLLDYILVRDEFYADAVKIMDLLLAGRFNGFVSVLALTNMFYTLRKDFDTNERKNLLIGLNKTLTFCSVTAEMVINALKNTKFTDFEDCVQTECAKSINADIIITRNLKHYKHSPIRIYSPDEFIKLFSVT
ncbi:MAG: PIN domain-containing protein [Ruminococcus sp.]|jgi:predicted nucleic acid-binding protein|nr:PIN domain-containing protein [Ruminococcus sp.]